jgi:hypothetical protein
LGAAIRADVRRFSRPRLVNAAALRLLEIGTSEDLDAIV